MKSWFIEDPETKDLVKKVTYKLPAESEKEFIIVMAAPKDKPQYNMATFLIIRMADQARKRPYLIEKHLKAGADLEDIELETHLMQNEA